MISLNHRSAETGKLQHKVLDGAKLFRLKFLNEDSTALSW